MGEISYQELKKPVRPSIPFRNNKGGGGPGGSNPPDYGSSMIGRMALRKSAMQKKFVS